MTFVGTPCILSPSPTNENGYAVLKTEKFGYGLHHRYVYARFHDIVLTKDDCICHHCDVRNCIEITHLFLGTVQDNNQDMVNKNRQAKGSKIAQSKLVESDVLEIRNKISEGCTRKFLASKYSVSLATIDGVINHRVWKHL